MAEGQPRVRLDPLEAEPELVRLQVLAREVRFEDVRHAELLRAVLDVVVQVPLGVAGHLSSTSMPCSFARFRPRIFRFAWSVSCGYPRSSTMSRGSSKFQNSSSAHCGCQIGASPP